MNNLSGPLDEVGHFVWGTDSHEPMVTARHTNDDRAYVDARASTGLLNGQVLDGAVRHQPHPASKQT